MSNTIANYTEAMCACVENGKRLLEDAEWLQGPGCNPTTLALTILAEEEFAKAFFLYLLQDGAIPSTPQVWRTLRDHQCKHLLTIMMEYLHVGDDIIPLFRTWICPPSPRGAQVPFLNMYELSKSKVRPQIVVLIFQKPAIHV
jgi:hypothetical protein